MGIMDFNAAATQRNTNGRKTVRTDANGQPLPESKLWLNVGYEVESKNEDGEDVVRFINLPLGIAVDTMEPTQVRGDGEFAQIRSAQNDLLKALQAAGDNLQPGEEANVKLVVKLRKVKDAVEIKKDENPFSIGISNLIG